MSIYQKFCEEQTDENGRLVNFRLKYPDNFNFACDVVDVIASETPEKRAVVWCSAEGEEKTFTFEDIRSWSCRFANVFTRAGIGRGDRVIVILKRHYEYWFTAVALHRIGALMIPATHMLTVKDLVYRMKAAQADAVICTAEDGVPEKIRAAAGKAGIDPKLWCARGSADGFENIMVAAVGEPDQFKRIETSVYDPMILYFTSGTTGDPKGVIHDHTYPLAHIVTARYWQRTEEGGLHFTVAETGWGKASWGKIYGQWLTGCAVMVYDFDSFDPKKLVDVINRFGVTSFCAPPTIYRYLVRKGIPAMPTLRYAATAGEMLAPEVFRKFTEQTGLPLNEGYGQTETTLLMANFKGEESVAGALGTPSPFYNIELRDRDGNPVERGEIGEIVIIPDEKDHQPGVFSAYLNNEEQYRHVWRGGVYHTGDAAYEDENGRFWFHGRFDDIIKTGGFRVGPYEVENVLMEHPAVVECSVIGAPDPLRGQAIKAVIVPAKQYDPTRELMHDIRDYCNHKLAEYKWIRIIEFVDEMPKTISGKIRKDLQREA